MKRNFSVSVLKSLNRRSPYVIALDFEQNTVNFHKIRRGKEFKRAFPFQSCIKLEKSQKDPFLLTLIFGPEPIYRKNILFAASEEREQFCNLVHAGIVTNTKAYQLFTSKHSSSSPASPERVIEFCDFLVAFAAEQTKIENSQIIASNQQNNNNRINAGTPSGTTAGAAETVVDSPASPDAAVSSSLSDVSDGLSLLDHEHIILRQAHVSRLIDADTADAADLSSRGNLFVTNYRILYRDYLHNGPGHINDNTSDIPLALIARLEKVNIRKIQPTVRIYCKNFQRVEFLFDANEGWIDGFIQQITRMAFPREQAKLFAYAAALDSEYNEVHASGEHEEAKFNIKDFISHTLYDPLKDYERVALAGNKSFRVVKELNANFELCATYPPLFVVPAAIGDEELREIAKFRSQGRFPLTVFLHPFSRASMSRCAQPLSGLKGKRSEVDERLFALLREINPTNSDTLYIIDARPYKAAMGNTVMGKGYESTNNYTQAKIEFMNIDNIHAIRNSYERLMECVYTESRSDAEAGWLARVESTQWLYYVRLLLVAAVRSCALMSDEGASIVVHCSDGWDRTSQICSLVELILDPAYRTFQGFAQLIEKEWLSMGHKFAERHGHADGNYAYDQRAPIWLQFLDSVYQMAQQFPTAFEFNEQFLVDLYDHSLTCRFGSFLFDSVKERSDSQCYTKTHSVWPFIMNAHNRYRYNNMMYAPLTQADIEEVRKAAANPAITRTALTALCQSVGFYCIPSTNPKRLQLWSRMHQRWDREFAQQIRIGDMKNERKLRDLARAQQIASDLHMRETGGGGWSDYSRDSLASMSQIDSQVSAIAINQFSRQTGIGAGMGIGDRRDTYSHMHGNVAEEPDEDDDDDEQQQHLHYSHNIDGNHANGGL